MIGTLPELNSLETHQVLTSLYETAFGIFNHIQNEHAPPQKKRPFAAMAFHPGEDTISGSLLEDTMKAYRDFPIWDIFKLNWKEWIAQPVDIVELQLSIARQRRDDELKIANAAKLKAEQEAARRQGIILPTGRLPRPRR